MIDPDERYYLGNEEEEEEENHLSVMVDLCTRVRGTDAKCLIRDEGGCNALVPFHIVSLELFDEAMGKT